ncbi:DUF4373 domain-containing protein [Ornithinibacillus sp. JPR2-1]|uniref:DUF4373 domain-containing protein n=1 Tax=Ornithinibacillus sp. JPR2-1 TaxID=2094019 RepID=UPI0031CF2751
MVRPIKQGLDYFPLDVDIDQDDKIALIEANHGLEGFGVVIKILMKIYDNSYFYEWGEKEQLLFSRRVNVNINRINDIINDCIKWGLFSWSLFEKHQILSSKGIQKRYLEAAARRKRVEIRSDYLLLDDEEVNVYKNLIIVDINPIDVDISTQSKAEESKAKESKAEDSKNETEKVAAEILSHYLKLRQQMHPSPKDEMSANEIAKSGIPVDKAIEFLDERFRTFQPKHSRDKINSLDYCAGFILDRYYAEKEGETHDNGLHRPRFSNGTSNGKGKSYAEAQRELESSKRAVLGR